MIESEKRKEALDLLARGKISIDEAVELLDHARGNLKPTDDIDEPVYKADMTNGSYANNVVGIEIEEDFNTTVPLTKEQKLQFEEFDPSVVKGNSKRPHWLRIQVGNLDTGKNKVTVNIPFAMVRFGLGIARVFSPEIEGVDLDEINSVVSSAETGLLVDLQDEESNEHVKISFE